MKVLPNKAINSSASYFTSSNNFMRCFENIFLEDIIRSVTIYLIIYHFNLVSTMVTQPEKTFVRRLNTLITLVKKEIF